MAVLAVAMVAGARAQTVWHVNTTADPGSGCSATNCTLRAAIGVAQSGDTIDVPAGHYVLSAGQLSISTNISIVGAGAGKTIIDANGASRVFDINASAGLNLSQVTVTGGDVTASYGNGGDILNNGTLSISHSTVSNGKAYYYGGDIESSRFYASAPLNAPGYGRTAPPPTLSISDSTISGGSSGQAGGGIDIGYGTPAAVVTNSTIVGNAVLKSDGSGGGGIYDGGSGLSVTNSTIARNRVAGNASGGGIYDSDYSTPGLLVKDSTIAGNSAPGAGGSNVYFYFYGPATGGFQDTIVADPKAPKGSTASPTNCANSGGVPTSLGHNLEDDAADSCGFSAAVHHDKVGVSPKLGPLANNGGPTRTMALQAGSPAIDGGVTIKGINTDQRGGPRPQRGAPDIGAYEYGAIADLGIAGTAAHPITVGHRLTYVLAVTNGGPTSDPAFAVQVVDSLPSSVTFASASPSGSCSTASGKVTCALGTLAHGGTKHVRITVIPQKVGFPSDSGSVSNTGLDPNSANNKTSITVPIQDKPAVRTDPSGSRTYHGATLHGHVNPNNGQTTYYFEYGPTTSYGSRTGTSNASGLSSLGVALSVQGLPPGRLYHYRIVAANSSGTSVGRDETFFTYFLPVLHVSPAQVQPGKRLRVYGNAGECPVADTVTLLSPAFSNAHTYHGEGAIYTTVHHHGFFSTYTRIPSSRHRGTYPVSGLCGRFPAGAAGDPGTAAAARAKAGALRLRATWTGRVRLS